MTRRARNWLPGLLLVSPSILLVGVFVYWLITKNVLTSLQRSTDFVTDRVINPGGYRNYTQLLASSQYQHALFNLLVLTVVFLAGTMAMGLLWSVLLERGVRGEGVFRSVYLFPMAVSFVAAGVVWRWLLSPAQGEGQAVGLNQLFIKLHLPGLQNGWWSADSRFSMAAMALPAIWQLSGYVMALFLAGFRGISQDQREAARIDGASEWQIYRHVLFPQLSPIALSALIIIGHQSMKMFDLIYSIAGPNSYKAEVPATLMWTQLFSKSDAQAAAVNATILLILVAVVVVPYLVYTNKVEERSR
ncbi:sugar ABC transporter permease [Phycicoccus endophyticus]|uniref:Sugar ABC transporter permease n=1 Tax=Phycicoccus endophyticus TaxID=1690220 RepID=A0A7G9R0K4_9MICO|nr:sugar ABC transporter permease [Phycicoccus endophyticus]NHI19408.1 sugar ABC transporter permease [Phycicoccus endophyticus]QNN49129.1 sugar ABC transporter permease [Phycicoccus endophyticus]